MTLLRFQVFSTTYTRDRRRPTTHTHTKTKGIGYRKPDRIKVRVSHSMTEKQGQRPKDCVLAGSKQLEHPGLGRKSPPLEKAPKTNKTDLEP